MVECGGLENRFTRNPGDEGSNPSSSASMNAAGPGEFPDLFLFPIEGIRPDEVESLQENRPVDGFREFARRLQSERKGVRAEDAGLFARRRMQR